MLKLLLNLFVSIIFFLFNIFSYNTTEYSIENYIESYQDLKKFPLLSSGNILFYYNDIYAYITVSKLNS